MYIKQVLVFLFFVFSMLGACAQTPAFDSVGSVAATAHHEPVDDSSIEGSQDPDFVIASLVVTSSGKETYSRLGHCALRMQNPVNKLDYCYSFEERDEGPLLNYIKFFTGQQDAGFFAIPTDEFLKRAREENRSVTQYTLNLTPSEEQQLWRYLDEDMVEGMYRKFNFSKYNCVSMCYVAIESCLYCEDIKVRKYPESMSLVNGKYFSYVCRNAQWIDFVMKFLWGTDADCYYDKKFYLCPELVGEVFANAEIVTLEGKRRPALLGKPSVILKSNGNEMPADIITPRSFCGNICHNIACHVV